MPLRGWLSLSSASLALCITGWACLALSLGPSVALAEPPGYGVIASELLSLDRVEAVLPELAAQQLAVSLEWPTEDLDNPQRWALVRRAEQLGITIIPWLLLPEDDGYWPCS